MFSHKAVAPQTSCPGKMAKTHWGFKCLKCDFEITNAGVDQLNRKRGNV